MISSPPCYNSIFLTNLGKWCQVIAFKVKMQKKYLIVTVSINFNKWALLNWNNRVWIVSFERFHPFQAVVMNILKSITNNVVYNAENTVHSILLQLNGALAFKINQNYRQKKLIMYFNT
ncbi:unnamed protein product [Rhizophagus irregularis]|nr:unnamed protein product [Rhizophagus irregularis]